MRSSSAASLSSYFVITALVWMVVMTARLYPQYKDALRIDGRVLTLAEYVDETCGQRMGPAAASCLSEAQDRGRRMVAREQGKSMLLIEAPLLGYALIYLPLSVIGTRLRPRSLDGTGGAV